MSRVLRPVPSTPGRPPVRKLPRLQTFVLFAAGMFAVSLLIIAGRMGGKNADTGPELPAAIEAVKPVANSTIPTQDEIGADLDDVYTGVLLIDDLEIPADQLTIVPALGQVTFRPGKNKEIERLAEGRHRATILFWPQEKGEAGRAEAKSYTWEFIAG